MRHKRETDNENGSTAAQGTELLRRGVLQDEMSPEHVYGNVGMAVAPENQAEYEPIMALNKEADNHVYSAYK